jgi:hypothetical protein
MKQCWDNNGPAVERYITPITEHIRTESSGV